VGFNKWESIETVAMERAPELAGAGGSSADWWKVQLPLPDLLFRVDFVTVDSQSGAVDNNGWVVCCAVLRCAGLRPCAGREGC